MAAKRSRTGCATCRRRKLKCDEQKPVCGQCAKSRRECIASEGVAFRHEQNAGLGKADSLKNFFKYRNTFTEEQLNNFVPIPPQLQFIQIQDPYAEDGESPTSPSQYQAVAAHTLEALSTAATEPTNYGQPGPFSDYSTPYGAPNVSRGGYGPARGDMTGAGVHGPNQNYNINSLLNPSSTPANMIDPNLDGIHELAQQAVKEGTQQQMDQHDQETPIVKHEDPKLQDDDEADAGLQLLRNFAQESDPVG